MDRRNGDILGFQGLPGLEASFVEGAGATEGEVRGKFELVEASDRTIAVEGISEGFCSAQLGRVALRSEEATSLGRLCLVPPEFSIN